MKKRLEADLISIAHRILQLKNKSDINQLYLESQKLYEKLSVLRFIDAHYGDVKPTIGQAAVLEDMERFYDKEEELPVETAIEMNEANLHQDETPAEIETVEETEVIESPEEETEIEEEPAVIPEREIEEAPVEDEIDETDEEENTTDNAVVNTDFEADIKEEQEVSEHVEELAADTPTEEILVLEQEDEERNAIENESDEYIEEDEILEEDETKQDDFEEIKEVEDEIATEEAVEATEEPVTEEIKEATPFSFTPNFSNPPVIDEPARIEAVQISFEDLLGLNYGEPQFVKVEDVAPLAPEPIFDPIEEKTEVESVIPELPRTISREHAVNELADTPPAIFEKSEEMATPLAKNLSLNDKFSKGIDIDLNDRIAFVKHLFGNSEEDYNRVLNQLITFDNFYETRNFIEEMVKPDYNDWKGKDDYAERFIDIIEKKFL